MLDNLATWPSWYLPWKYDPTILLGILQMLKKMSSMTMCQSVRTTAELLESQEAKNYDYM